MNTPRFPTHRLATLVPLLAIASLQACTFQASVSARTSDSEQEASPPDGSGSEQTTGNTSSTTGAQSSTTGAQPATTEAPGSTQVNPPPSKVPLKGSRLLLPEPIAFAGDETQVPTGAQPTLEQVLEYLRQNERVTQLRIEGHTHNQRSEEASLELSGVRAAAIKAWFVAQGVAADRIRAVGFGLQQPTVSNATAPGQAQNERIVFHVAMVDGKPYLGTDPLAGGKEFP